MRRYLYFITEDERHEEMAGLTEFSSSRFVGASKNEETTHRMRDWSDGGPGETWTRKLVSMGHHDFEGEDDFEARAGEVMKEKAAEIDDKHFEKAGISPEEARS